MAKSKSRSLAKTMWPSVGSPPRPRLVAKIGRNEACPCGSGKKYKDCHEKDGEAFLSQLAREAEKKHLKEVRAHLKEQGVPWWRRLFFRL